MYLVFLGSNRKLSCHAVGRVLLLFRKLPGSGLGPWPAGGQHKSAVGRKGRPLTGQSPGPAQQHFPMFSKGSSLSQSQEKQCPVDFQPQLQREAASPLGQQLWRPSVQPHAHCSSSCRL
ncbi:hypothetical protein LEMLEM_LOCUS167 [Lemmus lemmus]